MINLSLVFAAYFILAPEAGAFTLNLFGSNIPAAGWQVSSLSYDVDYTNCPSQSTVNAAIDSAVALWNSVPTTNLILSRGSSISTSVAAATSSSHSSGNPTIVCDPNFSTTVGVSGIQDISPAVAMDGLATASGKMIYYAIVLNVQSGAKANISSFNSTLFSVILAHEMGHTLGLGHSADINALMYYDASAKANLNLSQDDIDGISYLYPRNEPGAGPMLGCGVLAYSDYEKRRSDRDGNNSRSGSSFPGGNYTALAEFILIILSCGLMTNIYTNVSILGSLGLRKEY